MAVVLHMQFPGNEHHAFSRRMPVRWDGVIRGNLQKDVGIRLRRVAVEDGYLAPLREQWWARTPLELGITSGKGNRLVRRWICAQSHSRDAGEDTEGNHASLRARNNSCLNTGTSPNFDCVDNEPELLPGVLVHRPLQPIVRSSR